MLAPMIDTEGLKSRVDHWDFYIIAPKRTKALSIQVIYFYQTLPNTGEAKIIEKAAFTLPCLYYSIAVNYKTVCISRSRKAFLAKLSVLAEEIDEVLPGLALLSEPSIIPWEKVKLLFLEAREWLFIFSFSRKSAKNNLLSNPVIKINKQHTKHCLFILMLCMSFNYCFVLFGNLVHIFNRLQTHQYARVVEW